MPGTIPVCYAIPPTTRPDFYSAAPTSISLYHPAPTRVFGVASLTAQAVSERPLCRLHKKVEFAVSEDLELTGAEKQLRGVGGGAKVTWATSFVVREPRLPTLPTAHSLTSELPALALSASTVWRPLKRHGSYWVSPLSETTQQTPLGLAPPLVDASHC